MRRLGLWCFWSQSVQEHLGLCGGKDALLVKSNPAKSGIERAPRLEAAQHIDHGLAAKRFEDEVPDGLASHTGVFPIQNLHREDAIPHDQVF